MPGIVINPIPTYIWVDGTTADWNTPSAWYGGKVPDGTVNALIGYDAYETITVSQDQSINVLTLNDIDAQFVVTNGATFSAYGGLIDTGNLSIIIRDGTLLIGGAAPTLDSMRLFG